jgi:hypothetical protein
MECVSLFSSTVPVQHSRFEAIAAKFGRELPALATVFGWGIESVRHLSTAQLQTATRLAGALAIKQVSFVAFVLA